MVGQVSYSFSKKDEIGPFRDLLNSKKEFAWSENLERAFKLAKENIVSTVSNGVKCFVPGKFTALVSDWSKTGIGHALVQKHCSCKGVVLDCCKFGWHLVAIGSRFCSGAESKYAAVEGELLSVVWALHKQRYWTLQNTKFVLFVDHKPLLGLLQKRSLMKLRTQG